MGYPGAPNQTPLDNYADKKSGSSFFDDALNFAERGASVYANIKNTSANNPTAPVGSDLPDGETIAEKIAKAVSDAIPDSVVDAASKKGEQRYYQSLNARYNPDNIVGKGAAAVAVAIGAFWAAKKLRIL